MHFLLPSVFLLLLGLPAAAVPTLTIASPATGTLAGDYTTSKLFCDEILGDSIPLTITFNAGEANVTQMEIVTNLNQRDRATADQNGNGMQDAMEFPKTEGIIGSTADFYYRKFSYAGGPLVLQATKTGAYRLTARWKVSGDANWRWFTDGAANRRDHAITVSPAEIREYIVYEINTLTMESSGTNFATRSTLQDLSDRPGAIHTSGTRSNNFNLAYLQNLGVNTLWFQPWHPIAWEGRHLSAADINTRAPGSDANTWKWNAGSPGVDVNYPYAYGSPYAVKNFFEVESRLAADFVGDPTNQSDVSSLANRNRAMTALQNFVSDADAAGIRIMPDAAFNHTGHDVEVGPYWSFLTSPGNTGPWNATDRMDTRERRIFSRENDYYRRADLGFNLAPAPDRFDFGKWLDARDVYFGRYASLWRNSGSTDAQKNDRDWFDHTSPTYNSSTDSGGAFDSITQGIWKYFAQYAPFWLEKTRPAGQNRNSTAADGDTSARRAWDGRGIDGIRCDFAQGIPPQAWEYMINVARTYKWNFSFMAESLDGGAVTERSNRHFDILNENLLFSAKSPLGGGETWPERLRIQLENRRTDYGPATLLLNTTSHDEQNYNDPWEALIRYAVFATNDGAPMIFPGQELGVSDFYGYDLMEKNLGKFVPHFKTYNSMMPLWTNTDFGLDQLTPVYAAINRARKGSAALRSPNRFYLNLTSGEKHTELAAVAKYETPNGIVAKDDTVFAFVNTERNPPSGTNERSGTFNVNITQGGSNLFGIKSARRYNVKNIAAYTAQISGRDALWLWPEGITGRTGATLLAGGLFVSLPKIPSANANWTTMPYEAQYLKLYDVTAPPPPVPNHPGWAIAPNAVFAWQNGATAAEDVVTGYQLDGTSIMAQTTFTKMGTAGQTVSLTLRSVSAAGITSAPVVTQILLLSPTGDEDGDGQSNAGEEIAGTDPLDPGSSLRILSQAGSSSGPLGITISSVPGRRYTLQYSTDLSQWWPEDEPAAVNVTATGATLTLTDINPDGSRKFYRVLVEK